MSDQSASRPAILVVEDDRVFSVAIERYLQTLTGERYAIVLVGDGAEALMELQRREVPLVITDYHLIASMNGLKLTAAIRERWPETRVVLITAYSTPEVARAAAKEGVDFYLPKPFLLQDLEPIVRAVLALPSSQ